jgi:hypothetical protein
LGKEKITIGIKENQSNLKRLSLMISLYGITIQKLQAKQQWFWEMINLIIVKKMKSTSKELQQLLQIADANDLLKTLI